jgi:dTDP-4-dehydrorhamnose 3,5-epimerase-like enzyme
MTFSQTRRHGACIIGLESVGENRGFLSRSFAKTGSLDHALNTRFVRYDVFHSRRKRTLRGMH